MTFLFRHLATKCPSLCKQIFPQTSHRYPPCRKSLIKLYVFLLYHETIICRFTVRFSVILHGIICSFPFRPSGPLSPKGTAFSRNRRASNGCAWRPPRKPVVSTTDAQSAPLRSLSRQQRMCVASPLGKLSRQRLKGQLLLLPASPDVNHPHLHTQAVFHLSLPPLACSFPFRPFGPLSQKGTAFSRNRHASNGCAWRSLGNSVVSTTDAQSASTEESRVSNGCARRPLRGSCRVSD